MATIRSVEAGHQRGTPGYRRLGAAMWCAGLATFVLVYSPQALLATFAAEFGVSSSMSSLALSATTLTLALAVVPLSAVTESWGRTRMMTAALAVSAALGLLAPFSPTFGVLVGVRALQGVALAALPALAMAHMTREVAPRWLGGAVGLLIAGNALGGLTGRLITGFVADVAGWRVALGVIGGVSLLCTVAFRLLLPTPRAPDVPRLRLRDLGGPLRRHLADPVLRSLFAVSFLVMGAFVTVYNYSGFRLEAPPFGVPVGLAGLMFLGYLAGPVVSPWAGRLADRFGRAPIVAAGLLVAAAGAWVTLPANLVVICVGVLLVTIGFFAAHAVASGWTGRRAAEMAGRVARAGVVDLPAGLLRGQQCRRLAGRRRLRPTRLARRLLLPHAAARRRAGRRPAAQNVFPRSRARAWAASRADDASAVTRLGRNAISSTSSTPAHASQSRR